MKKIIYVPLMLSILLSTSCDKNKSCKTLLDAPVVTNNSPVIAGDTVILSIPDMENTTCNWNGPFSFHSDSNSIAIVAYDTHLSGTFNVQYFTQDCLSDLATADVVITPIALPCTYPKNHGEVIGYRPAITFTNVHSHVSSDSVDYSLHADAGSDIEFIGLTFHANVKPQNGVYTISGNYDLNPGEVDFFLFLSDDSWSVPAGKVYVNTVNGKLTATWCDLPCHRWDGLSGTTSGSFTEP